MTQIRLIGAKDTPASPEAFEPPSRDELLAELAAVTAAVQRAEDAFAIGDDDPFAELRAWRCGAALPPAESSHRGLGHATADSLPVMCTIVGRERIARLAALCEEEGVPAADMVTKLVLQVLRSGTAPFRSGSLHPLQDGGPVMRRHLFCTITGEQEVARLKQFSETAGCAPGELVSAIVLGCLSCVPDVAPLRLVKGGGVR